MPQSIERKGITSCTHTITCTPRPGQAEPPRCYASTRSGKFLEHVRDNVPTELPAPTWPSWNGRHSKPRWPNAATTLPRPPDLRLDLSPRRHRRRRDGRSAAELRSTLQSSFNSSTPRIVVARTINRRNRKVSGAARRRPADRVRVHPGHTGHDVLRLHAGGLRHGLRFLPHRQDGSRAQPYCRRNRRSGPCPADALGAPGQALQHRPDGHG